jgi:hypothetical protein
MYFGISSINTCFIYCVCFALHSKSPCYFSLPGSAIGELQMFLFLRTLDSRIFPIRWCVHLHSSFNQLISFSLQPTPFFFFFFLRGAHDQHVKKFRLENLVAFVVGTPTSKLILFIVAATTPACSQYLLSSHEDMRLRGFVTR